MKFQITLSLLLALTTTLPAQSTAKLATGANMGGSSKSFPCWLLPLAQYSCMKVDKHAAPDQRREQSNTAVNTFWSTTANLSYFNQIKSNYNGASGSTTLSADLVTLNFNNGLQLVSGTNLQAAPAATNGTLSAASAAQAAQNLLRGGTIYFAALYPVINLQQSPTEPGGFSLRADLIARQGFDIQAFKPSTNLSLTQPPSHTNLQFEGYVLYNSSNPPQGATTGFAGSVFIGGSYGYAYASHQYARDYGFGPRLSHPIGELSLGLLIHGLGKISISRAFGPAQTYTDPTTQRPVTIDNFKSWTFGLTYQSKTNAL